MKKIVMTGPTGAIGVALIEQCINENIEVYALCRKDSRRISNIPQSPLVHIIFCDLQEMSEFNDDQIKGADVFYHFGWVATIGAGRNDMPLQIQNIQYTIDAVHLAKRLGCSVFVGAGSQAEYGRVEGKLNAEVPTFPENGYGMAKLCAGQMSRVECEKLGLKHIWTRILSIYGPYDGDATMITSTIKKLLNGQIPELTKGEQMWDYMYSKDVAKAFVALGDRGVHGKIYCLGSGQVRPLKEYIEILRDKIDVRAKLGFGEIPYAPKQVMYLCADISDLQNDTGFTPQISFEKGIQETIDWIKSGK